MIQKTLLDMINDAKSRLSEGGNSPAGQLTTGTGGVLISTEATMVGYFNDGSADLARGCYPIRDIGTLTASANQFNFPWDTFTVASGSMLWHAEMSGVSFSNIPLIHINLSALRTYFRTWATDPAGYPKYWYHQGNDGIGVYPKLATGGVLTVDGYAIPPTLANFATVITAATNTSPSIITAAGHGLSTGQTVGILGAAGNTAINGQWVVTVIDANNFSVPVAGNGAYTGSGTFADVITWFEPDLLNLLAFYVAGKTAEKNQQRADLAQRAQMWLGEFNQGKQQLLAQLWKDPLSAQGHFPGLRRQDRIAYGKHLH